LDRKDYPLMKLCLRWAVCNAGGNYVEARMTVRGPLKRWHPGFRLPDYSVDDEYTRACIQHWPAERTFCCAPCHGPQLANPYVPSAGILPLSRSTPGRHLMEWAMQQTAIQTARGSKALLNIIGLTWSIVWATGPCF
jgi:hypothetical protein